MILFILFFAIAASDKALITHSCPGGKSVCPDSATCCLINEGIYGCCPMMDAVCCNDLIHCCPPATKCDMIHRQCLQDTVEYNPVQIGHQYRCVSLKSVKSLNYSSFVH